MGLKTEPKIFLLAVIIGLGLCVNTILPPSLPDNVPFSSHVFGTLFKWAGIAVPALIAYFRPMGLRSVVGTLAATLALVALAEIAQLPLPHSIFHALYYFCAGLSITAIAALIYYMPLQDMRAGVTLGFSLSLLITILLRLITTVPTTAIRPYLALVYVAAILAVAFVTPQGRESFPAARDRVRRLGGMRRFAVVMFANSGAARLVVILGTMLIFIVGIFSNYVQVVGISVVSSNLFLVCAFIILLGMFVLSLIRTTRRYFYTVFAVLLIGCVGLLVAAALVPRLLPLVASGFSVVQMLTWACFCIYTLEFAKEQEISPLFMGATLPLVADIARFLGECLDMVYCEAVRATVPGVAPIACLALAIIALAVICLLVAELSRRDDEQLGMSGRPAASQRGASSDAARTLAAPATVAASEGESPVGSSTGEQTQCSSEYLVDGFGLTKSEADVTLMFARGMTAQEISELRVVSRATVKTQLKRAYSKLDVHSKQELVDLLAKSPSV